MLRLKDINIRILGLFGLSFVIPIVVAISCIDNRWLSKELKRPFAQVFNDPSGQSYDNIWPTVQLNPEDAVRRVECSKFGVHYSILLAWQRRDAPFSDRLRLLNDRPRPIGVTFHAGWPLRCMKGDLVVNPRSVNTNAWELSTNISSISLIWTNVVFNAAFCVIAFMAIRWLIKAIVKCRILIRRQKGMCVYCGYLLMSGATRCPECGGVCVESVD
jgi:hypothetical protein